MKKQEKHGMANSPEYSTWVDMKQRCLNQNCCNYDSYGGRGITVCEEWINSFINFFNDMGVKPPNHTLDRKNVDGDYNKENCRWADVDTQNRNKRNNKYIEFNNKNQSLVSHCEELNLNYQAVISRLNKHGWSIEKALSTPTKKKYIKKTNKAPVLSV